MAKVVGNINTPNQKAAVSGSNTTVAPQPALPEEAEIVALLQTDSELVAILSGGIYAYTALGRLGVSRDGTPAAFDAGGFLKPLCVIKARAPVPDERIYDEVEKLVAQAQMMECWLYQYVGYNFISAAATRIFRDLQGYKFTNAWPAQWAFTTPPLQDNGALLGASTQRMDFMMRRLRKA